jgi:outer membrane biosynthesis protein TonB
VSRMQAGLIVSILAGLLAAGAPATIAVADDLLPADTAATGTTGAQSAATCPKPRLSGLPKRPKFTNATIHFKLTNMTVGASYLIRAGGGEVTGGAAQTPTVKDSFLLPDQGTKDRKTVITAIVDTENCTNAPWKLQKPIHYNAITAPPATSAPPAPATRDAPAAAPTPVPAAPVKPVKPVKPIAPVKPVKPIKPIKSPWQTVPKLGTPLGQRTWMVPIDGASRMQDRVAEARLSRLEQKTDKASSSNALVGLGIVGALFVASTIAGLWAFVRRDEVQFERAMEYQLKHLDEGDLSMLPDEEPDAAPFAAAEAAPFAEPEPAPSEAPTEPVPEVVAAPTPAPAPTAEELVRHRAEVEQQLQRILNEAGLEAELQGILADARSEAERQGVVLDTDLMLQALCEEINGSAKLSDEKREQLRAMFAGIIAEEAQTAPTPESVATS